MCLQAVFNTCKNAVAHAVTALIAVKLSLYRLPAWIPNGIAVLYVEIMTAIIKRNIIVTITCKSQQLCILIEAIAATCVGLNREEILTAKVINPWQRGFWGGNDILSGAVIEISVFHSNLLFFGLFKISSGKTLLQSV